MRITHLCLGCFFPDGYSYQENLLPKFHKILGHDVTVIASLQTFDSNGNISYMESASEYINENDVLVKRLNYRSPQKIYRKLKRFVGTFSALEKTNPEVLFIHGCQFLDMDIVVKYLKMHGSVKVFVDNHADFSNSAKSWVSLNIMHKILWKHCAHIVTPFTGKFYGVLPARVDFLKNVYAIPEEKIELLVMGADDEKVREALRPTVRKSIREKYGIDDEDFLIMTGGKIDEAKRQTLFLMEAVNKLANPHVKLIVFGSVIPELKEAVMNLQSMFSRYIGWVNSEETTNYYAAADLVVFPGRHSVFWEQVVGLGKPMVCKYWDGTTHVDVGGNVRFIHHDSAEELIDILRDIIENDGVYKKMKEIAQIKGKKTFSYLEIAKRSIGV